MSILNLPTQIEKQGGYINTNDILGILLVLFLATFTAFRTVSNYRKIKKKEQNSDDVKKRGFEKYNSGDFKGAVCEYDTAISLNPDDIEAFMYRGLSKYELGNSEGGLEDINKAIKLYPGYAIAYMNRGIIKSKLGNRKEAERDFAYAIELNPDLAKLRKDYM